MIVQQLIFLGAIVSLAGGGCRLEEICEAVPSELVDPFVTELPVTTQCSGPDASSAMWYIRRYDSGNESLDGLGALLTLNDSFLQIGNQLEILNVNGFAEGAYHCGVDINNIRPASLCLFVRGRPFFTSCPGEFEACPSVTNIIATENEIVSLDTRIDFADGGSCELIKTIRFLIVNKDGERVYVCSNLTTFINQLCEDNDLFRVELQQSCTPPDTTLCKYDMKLVFRNFDESDEGLYDVEVTFEDDQIGRGTLTQQFYVTVGSTSPTSSPTTSFATTSSTTSTIPGGGLSDGVIAAIIIILIIIIIIILVIISCIIIFRVYKFRRLSPLMTAISNGLTEVVEVIIEHCVDLDLEKASYFATEAGYHNLAHIIDKVLETCLQFLIVSASEDCPCPSMRSREVNTVSMRSREVDCPSMRSREVTL